MHSVIVRDIAGGRIQLAEEIGEGGMGTVYRGRWLHEGAHGVPSAVAVKMFDKNRVGDADGIARFINEAKVGLLVGNHSNIARTYDICEDEEFIYLVMEHVDGMNLSKLMKSTRVHSQRGKKKGARQYMPTLDLVAYLISEIAYGLSHAHRLEHAGRPIGIVHCDLKASNVMVSMQGEVKLVDFGVSKTVITPHRGTVSGTPTYMAPEQYRGEKVDKRADMFALGTLLHWLLCGKTPRSGMNEDQIASHIRDAGEPPDLPDVLAVQVADELDTNGNPNYRPLTRDELPAVFDQLRRRLLQPKKTKRLAEARDVVRLLEDAGYSRNMRGELGDMVSHYLKRDVPRTRTTMHEGNEPEGWFETWGKGMPPETPRDSKTPEARTAPRRFRDEASPPSDGNERGPLDALADTDAPLARRQPPTQPWSEEACLGKESPPSSPKFTKSLPRLLTKASTTERASPMETSLQIPSRTEVAGPHWDIPSRMEEAAETGPEFVASDAFDPPERPQIPERWVSEPLPSETGSWRPENWSTSVWLLGFIGVSIVGGTAVAVTTYLAG